MELEWRRGAQQDVENLPHRSIQDEVLIGVLDVLEDPFAGEPLRYLPHIGDLSDCRKLYIDIPPDKRPPGPPRYRIVYRLRPDERHPIRIEIVAIGPRADERAYWRALVRLERPPGRRST